MRPAQAASAFIVLAFITLIYRFHDIKPSSVTEPFRHPTSPGVSPHEGNEVEKGKLHAYPSQGSHAENEKFDPSDNYTVVYSATTRDKKYFRIDFGEQKGINPNIIPHPYYNETWIVVAQLDNKRAVPHSVFFTEIICTAVFKEGVLGCNAPTAILPIAATSGTNCKGDEAYFSWSIGPHDARIFYGPTSPYAIYGSLSDYACFGMWMLDFRVLTDWGVGTTTVKDFKAATELQRPLPYGVVEKNWFVFWDKDGQIYVHQDIAPKRVFTKLNSNGSVGTDLAPAASENDEKCMKRYMPTALKAKIHLEDIHQATNSLAITLCKRADSSCIPSDKNTFIMTIFHHKSYIMWHGVYEPYVMLFQQTAPFAVHAISQKPIWINGRGGPGTGVIPKLVPQELRMGWNQTEMLFTTSISWKSQTQKYHGFLDDVMFVGFGVEDHDTAAIDVLAGDLLRDLALCSSL